MTAPPARNAPELAILNLWVQGGQGRSDAGTPDRPAHFRTDRRGRQGGKGGGDGSHPGARYGGQSGMSDTFARLDNFLSMPASASVGRVSLTGSLSEPLTKAPRLVRSYLSARVSPATGCAGEAADAHKIDRESAMSMSLSGSGWLTFNRLKLRQMKVRGMTGAAIAMKVASVKPRAISVCPSPTPAAPRR